MIRARLNINATTVTPIAMAYMVQQSAQAREQVLPSSGRAGLSPRCDGRCERSTAPCVAHHDKALCASGLSDPKMVIVVGSFCCSRTASQS